MALDHIDPRNERDYHISFDIDALDRLEAPSTGISRKFKKKLPKGKLIRFNYFLFIPNFFPQFLVALRYVKASL